MKPTIGVIYAPGTNCHEETAFAVNQAGGEARIVLLSDLAAGTVGIEDLQGLVFPGGFSFGDHIAAGRVLAVQIIARLAEALRAHLAKNRPILGICNGDQVLMETGLLPAGAVGRRTGALTQNRSARFEDRWVRLAPADGGLFWTAGLQNSVLRMPSAHGEGRLTLAPNAHIRPVFRYVDQDGAPTMSYPANPSGSPAAVAGIADPSGLVLGLMPHPERAVLPAHGSTDGAKIFANMIEFCR